MLINNYDGLYKWMRQQVVLDFRKTGVILSQGDAHKLLADLQAWCDDHPLPADDCILTPDELLEAQDRLDAEIQRLGEGA